MKLQLLALALSLFAVWNKFIAASSVAPEWVSSKPDLNSADVERTAHHTEAGVYDWLSQNPIAFFSSLYGASIFIRALVLGVFVANIGRLYHATKLPRAVSLTHWAGTVLAHRGYRSEAQQANKLIVKRVSRSNSRVSSGVFDPALVVTMAGMTSTSLPPLTKRMSGSNLLSHSRRGSRDESALMSAAALAAQTVGASSPRVPPGLPLASGAIPKKPSTPPASTPPRAPSPFLASTPDVGNWNIPENSMLAFIYAHEHGVHGVEVDVALTKDNEILVMHDNTLDRTMEATGELPDYTLAEIHQFRYRQVTDQEYTIKDPRNKKIDVTKAPTLEQVIIFCKERNLRLMIETKEYVDHNLLRRKIKALFDRHDMYAWSFVATFNPWHLYWYRREFPLIPTCLLYCRTCTEWYHEDASKEMLLPDMLNYPLVRKVADWLLFYFSPTYIADWMGVAMVGPHNILISPALISSLTTRGIVCDVWTVNTPLEKQWLKSLGCVVTSDRLFSHEDVSPFEVEAKPSLAARVPSIHAAEEFITSQYYISNSRPESPMDEAEEDYEEDQLHKRHRAEKKNKEEAAADAAEAADLASSGDDINETRDSMPESPFSPLLQSPDPLVGRGVVSLAHLRTTSQDSNPPDRSPIMTPASLAVAQDRLSNRHAATPRLVPMVDTVDGSPSTAEEKSKTTGKGVDEAAGATPTSGDQSESKEAPAQAD